MAVTTRTADQLIKEAYKIIGLKGKDRNLPQDYVVEGLYTLNMLIDHYSTAPNLISYDHVLRFPLVIDQSSYVISDQVTADVTNRRLVSLKYVNLLDGDHRYVVKVENDTLYYNFDRDETVSRRPDYCFLQLDVGESIITFIEKPDQAYTCIVKGKFILDQLDLTSEITAVPIGFHRFLKYALARELRTYHPGSNWTDLSESVYQESLTNVTSTNDKDIELKRDNLFVFRGRYRRNENAINVI